MFVLEWGLPDERYFHHGIDRGVLYPSGAVPGVVWNGITGLNESGNGSSTVYYIDGQIYLSDVDPTDFSGSFTAYNWPEEFNAIMGIPQVAEGLFLDNQKAKRFSFAYRSLVGSGVDGDMFGYQIHLIYNAMATIGNKSRRSLSDKVEPMEFSFDLVATPERIPGFRPTAHFIIDTRYLTPETVTDLEKILYGEDGVSDPRMPSGSELFELMNFGDAITVTVYPDGTLKYEGKGSNIVITGPDTYQINNVNSTAPDGDGEYVVSDGGDTDVIIV